MEFERIYSNPFEHPELEGWYFHPNLNFILVHKEEPFLKFIIKGSVVDGNITFWNGYARSNNFPVHRLKVETFLETPEVEDGVKLIPNHIDGDKTNDVLDNLEWTTYSGNLIHAYESGLRKENFTCTLTDLKTDEVHEFHSLSAAAKFLELPPANLTVYLRKPRNYPLMFKYMIKVTGINTTELTKKDLCKPPAGRGVPFYLVDNETGEKEVIPTLVVLKERFPGTTIRSFCHALTLKLKSGKWSVMKIEDPDVLIEIVRTHPYFKELKSDLKQRGNFKKKSAIKIKVTNLLTNEVKIYPSVLNFCETHNFKKGSVQKAIWRDNRWKHYNIEYLSK